MTAKEQLESSVAQTVEKTFEMIRCAQELYEEQKISEMELHRALELCEAGLPFAAEVELRQILVRKELALTTVFQDDPITAQAY